MAGWFDRGRPAIFKALREVCDRIDSDLAAELQERDVEQHAFLTKEVERLRSRIATVDKLEDENHALKDEVSALRDQIRSASSTADKLEDENRALKDEVSALRDQVKSASAAAVLPPTRQPLGEISSNTPSRLGNSKLKLKETGDIDAKAAAKHAALLQDYQRLVAQCEQQRRAKGDAEAKARKYREERDQWQKYGENCEAKLDKLKKRLGTSPQPQSSTEPRLPNLGLESSRAGATLPDGISVSTSKATLASSVAAHSSASASFSGFENAALADISSRRASSNPPEVKRTELTDHSTNSTQGDDDGMPEDGVELPQLPPDDGALPNTVIKNEPSSDLPVFVSEKRVAKRKHIDGAADDSRSRTPRRLKLEERSSDPLVMGESHHFSPQESLDLDTDGAMPTPRKIRMLQMQDHFDVISPGNGNIPQRSGIFDVRSPVPSTVLRDAAHATGSSVKDLQVFATPTNRPSSMSLVPRKTAPNIGSKPNQLNHGVASLAEDGYDPTRSTRHDPTRGQLNEGPSRLATLLNASSPLPQGQTPILRPTRQSREAPRSLWLTETPVRMLPFGKEDGKESNLATTKTGGGLDLAPASVKTAARMETPKTATPSVSNSRAKTTRLRDQPLASLRLDDFKINPKFNNGHDFAFTEVVRRKEARADIPGCVDPECCGKHFRAMAQSELEAAGPSLIHRAGDIALLEDYLGDQVYKLGSMTRQEKEELWLEAKTRELANKHGKHRHRFTRRQSPPGFWNTDFPSTQDNEKDRAEGEKREKRMVEERFREAMREGGRWLFRDE